MAATRRYTGVDDFGLIQRGDDVALCASGGAFNRGALCKVIDDAVLYYKMQGPEAMDALVKRMGQPPSNLPGQKPGRIIDFYRVVAAIRFAQRFGGRALTLAEMMFVIESSNQEDDRWDDFSNVAALTKAALGVQLTAQEEAAVAPYRVALRAAKTGQYDKTPAVTTSGGGGGGGKKPAAPAGAAVAPLALAAGGFLVGGPIGAGVGLAVGLAAGRKK